MDSNEIGSDFMRYLSDEFGKKKHMYATGGDDMHVLDYNWISRLLKFATETR